VTTDGFDAVLPTYALMARFRLEGSDPVAAPRHVVERLTAAEMPFHEVEVERTEPDGTVLVVVRFVEASVDGSTAVAGLYDTLRAAELDPDEVWVDREFA
jgi:hypothetical protein